MFRVGVGGPYSIGIGEQIIILLLLRLLLRLLPVVLLLLLLLLLQLLLLLMLTPLIIINDSTNGGCPPRGKYGSAVPTSSALAEFTRKSANFMLLCLCTIGLFGCYVFSCFNLIKLCVVRF